MKIRVANKAGEIEAITLTEPIVIRRGRGLNTLTTATDCSHFFDQDGSYDGYEMPFSGTLEEADGSIRKGAFNEASTLRRIDKGSGGDDESRKY